MIVTLIGVFFLHGMFLGSNTFNHNWFLTMYAFIVLCFARTNDAWSVDYHLSKIRRRRTRKSDRQPPFYIFDNSIGVAEWKQWILSITRPVLIEDLVTKALN